MIFHLLHQLGQFREFWHCPNLQRKKIKQKPTLTQNKQELKRVQNGCRKDLTRATLCQSDAKKFNLDGPDGFQHYWQDQRGEERFLSKRKFGGGSSMIREALGLHGKSQLIIMSGTRVIIARC